jgi:hypothetical protein
MLVHNPHADANAAFNIALAMAFAHTGKVPCMKAVSEPAESALPSMLGEQGICAILRNGVFDARASLGRG